MEQKVNDVIHECWLRALEAKMIIDQTIANLHLAKVLNEAKQDCKRASNIINSFDFSEPAYTSLFFIHAELTKHENEIVNRMKSAQSFVIQKLHTPHIYKDWNDIENEVLKMLTDLNSLKNTLMEMTNYTPVFQ